MAMLPAGKIRGNFEEEKLRVREDFEKEELRIRENFEEEEQSIRGDFEKEELRIRGEFNMKEQIRDRKRWDGDGSASRRETFNFKGFINVLILIILLIFLLIFVYKWEEYAVLKAQGRADGGFFRTVFEQIHDGISGKSASGKSNHGIGDSQQDQEKNGQSDGENISDTGYNGYKASDFAEDNEYFEFEIDENATNAAISRGKPLPNVEIDAFESVKVEKDSDSVQIFLRNPKENNGNYNFVFTLSIDGEEIYKSKLVPPGQYIASEKLSKTLSAGEYDLKVFIQPYTIEGNKKVNNAAFYARLIAE